MAVIAGIYAAAGGSQKKITLYYTGGYVY